MLRSVMDSIYERLAAKLDEFPHGFPRTVSGVELCNLEKMRGREYNLRTLGRCDPQWSLKKACGRIRSCAEWRRMVLSPMRIVFQSDSN
jgi:hypothetical protein